MRMTSKGQVTIPKEVRDELGLRPGSEVDFPKQGNNFIVAKRAAASECDAAEKMIRHMIEFGRRAKRITMSDRELMELTRGPFDDVNSH